MRDLGLERQIARQPVSSSPWPDESRIAFPELAMPLFGSLYNFAHWLTRNREDAEDLVLETYVKALRGFRLISTGHELSSVDLSNLEEHLRNLAVETCSEGGCAPQLRGGFGERAIEFRQRRAAPRQVFRSAINSVCD
jgi:hypothetical protein